LYPGIWNTMNYRQTIDFLYSQLPAYHRIGKPAYKNNLFNTLAMDDHFDHPHSKYKTIHIAGTNGKGSVSHMIASVLQEAGYKTGLYTSPHLKDFRERIKVNGKIIPQKEVIAFVKNNHSIIEKVNPSFFEMTVVMAFDYFARSGVDVAVIETGMGGRLDSTNIISPIVSVITNIGHDHMDLLGNTLGEIAFEKAGIIKKNVPVIIGETQDETKEIFFSKSAELDSDIYFADSFFNCRLAEHADLYGERQFIINDFSMKKKISGTIPLGGDYQHKNLQTLFQTVNILKRSFNLSESSVLRGLRNTVINTGIKGRWQILNTKPLTICDTGHNKEGLEYVLRQIRNIPNTGLHIVIGFVNDKDTTSILPLFPKKARYYFTRASVPRALDEKILQLRAREFDLSGDSYSSVKNALKAAGEIASESDLIFIGGSTFVVAEVV
jgi:dihydrofolate synthase/folylpolyglutamate synthase